MYLLARDDNLLNDEADDNDPHLVIPHRQGLNTLLSSYRVVMDQARINHVLVALPQRLVVFFKFLISLHIPNLESPFSQDGVRNPNGISGNRLAEILHYILESGGRIRQIMVDPNSTVVQIQDLFAPLESGFQPSADLVDSIKRVFKIVYDVLPQIFKSPTTVVGEIGLDNDDILRQHWFRFLPLMKLMMDHYNQHESDFVQPDVAQPRCYPNEMSHFLKQLLADPQHAQIRPREISTTAKKKLSKAMATCVNQNTELHVPLCLEKHPAFFNLCLNEVDRIRQEIKRNAYRPRKPRDMRGFRSMSFVPLHGVGSHRYMGINTSILCDILRFAKVPANVVLGEDFRTYPQNVRFCFFLFPFFLMIPKNKYTDNIPTYF
jgi:hypothetical protein